MQVVANQWRHVVILAATKDDTSGTVQDALHFVCLLLSAGGVLKFNELRERLGIDDIISVLH